MTRERFLERRIILSALVTSSVVKGSNKTQDLWFEERLSVDSDKSPRHLFLFTPTGPRKLGGDGSSPVRETKNRLRSSNTEIKGWRDYESRLKFFRMRLK